MTTRLSTVALVLAATFLAPSAQGGRIAPRTDSSRTEVYLAGAGRVRPGQPRAWTSIPDTATVRLTGNTSHRPSENVLRVIRQHVGGFRYSYEKRLRTRPRLQGKLTLDFTISAQGEIVAISQAASTLKDPDFEQEILDKAHRMRFDAAKNGTTTVRYEVTFLPQPR